MWTYARPGRSLSNLGWLGLLAAAVAVAGLAALTIPAARAIVVEQPRCYWIGPPLADYQRELLNQSFLDCTAHECRATLHQSLDSGWVCFYHRPWAGPLTTTR